MKRGQLKLSFGMIFSIILIVLFLAVAIYGIITFLNLQDSAKVGLFLDDLQADVNKIWASSQSLQSKEYLVPLEINYVCFVDFSAPKKGEKSQFYEELKKSFYGSENLIFYPLGSSNIDSLEIENLNIEKTTETENPFCLNNVKGKISMKLKKDYQASSVTIIR